MNLLIRRSILSAAPSLGCHGNRWPAVRVRQTWVQPLCACWCLSVFCDLDENAANYSCAYLMQGKSRGRESQDQWFSASEKSFSGCTLAYYEMAEREIKLESSSKKHPSRACLESRIETRAWTRPFPQYSAGFWSTKQEITFIMGVYSSSLACAHCMALRIAENWTQRLGFLCPCWQRTSETAGAKRNFCNINSH